MKAIHLVAPKKLEVVELPQPADPGPGEVLLKVRSVGICGSDLHWFLDGRIGGNICVLPQILGHEPVAEVVAVGKGVPESRIGERAFVEPAIGCGHCEWCISGNQNLCPTCRFLGSSPTYGLFREYGVMPAHNLVPAPAGVSDAQATVAEPLSIILHVMELAGIRLGDTVAVLGSGPIGMLSVAVAKLAGASKIFVADKVAHRVALGLRMGADVGIHSQTESVCDTILDATGGRGVDFVMDAAGMTETINWGMKIARRGGQFILIGIPTEPDLNIDLHTAMHREIRIQTIRRSRHSGPTAMALIQAGRVSDAMITHRYPLERTPEAFDTLAEYADGVGKDHHRDRIMKHYLAFDLGAESGRAMLGTIADGKLVLEELHRFPNTPVRVPTGLYWDTFRLFHEILEGLRIAGRERKLKLDGIGIDTWGVDFGLLGADGALVDNPRHYRDARNNGMMERAYSMVPKRRDLRAHRASSSCSSTRSFSCWRCSWPARPRSARPAGCCSCRTCSTTG